MLLSFKFYPKYRQTAVFLLLLLTSYSLYGQQAGKQLFNEGWEFQLGELELEEAQSTEQGGWRSVAIPHDWSIAGPFSPEWASGTGFLPGGVAWYKKAFSLDNYNENTQYSIYFDGVYKNSEVWINGHYLGKRPFGFIPFQYDLTPHLKPEDNELLVKVDHTNFADARYYTGSGLYRNVYLIASNPIHFSQWGVFFHTPEVSDKRALAQVEIEVDQLLRETTTLQILTVLSDSEGTKVSSSTQDIPAKKGKGIKTTMELSVENPKLWSPDHPNLYTLKIEIREGGQLMDQWTEKVGIRSFRFDADKGFFLNGESTLIKGVCIHHDAGGLGAAVPREVWKNRLATLKALGSNAIRMSHYPHQDYIYELCDEMGFLVQDEAFDEWEYAKNKWIEGWNAGKPGNDRNHDEFQEWAEQDVADMVRRNRSRPSIIMWSIGNEIDYPNDPYSHPVLDEGRNPQIYGKGYQKGNPPAAELGEISARLVKAVKQWDETRPVTAALAGVSMSNETDYPGNLDIVGYNYQEYRYQEDHEAYPDRVIYGSENGDALEAWLAVTENEFISSQFLWTAFDFIGEARPWPQRSSGAGIIDLAGNPKPDYYFRQSLWNDEPMVYLGIASNERQVLRRANITNSWTGTSGDSLWVTSYTNADEVELFLNGRSLGRKEGVYRVDQMISWGVPYEPGKLEAKAYNAGREVATYTLQTPGKVSRIAGDLSRPDYSKAGDIIELNLRLTDDKGTLVEFSDTSLSVTIDGPAEILAMESGDLSSHEDYRSPTAKTFQGKLKVYMKATDATSPLKITVSSSSLPDVQFTVGLAK